MSREQSQIIEEIKKLREQFQSERIIASKAHYLAIFEAILELHERLSAIEASKP